MNDIDNNIVDLVAGEKYYDFSKAIKQELDNRVNSHPTVKAQVDEFERLQKMKDIFQSIKAVTASTSSAEEET